MQVAVATPTLYKEKMMQQNEKVIARRAHLRMIPLAVEIGLLIMLFSIVYACEPHLWLGIPFLVIVISMTLRLIYLLIFNLLPRDLMAFQNKTLIFLRKKSVTIGRDEIVSLKHRNTRDYNLFTAYLTDSKYAYGKLYVKYCACGKIKKVTLKNVIEPSRVIDDIYNLMGFKHVE